MQNARLDEEQAGIKITGRNINNLRYAEDTTLMEESKELKNLLMKVKEEGDKAGLKSNIQKTKMMESDPIPSWQTDGKQWKLWQTLFGGVSKILVDGECSHEIKRHLFFERKVMTNLPGGSEVKTSACNAGDLGSIPGLGRSPGEGNGNPLQYSCLESPMAGGACWATVYGVTKSWTQLSDWPPDAETAY